jgi:hypothetical protein
MAEVVRTLRGMRIGCVKSLSRHIGRICRKEWRERYDGVLRPMYIEESAIEFLTDPDAC